MLRCGNSQALSGFLRIICMNLEDKLTEKTCQAQVAFCLKDFRDYLIGTNDNILSNGWTECYQDPHCQCFHQSLARLPLDATRDEKISYIDRLPNEILGEILTETLLSSAFSWPSHVCRTYNDLKNVSVRFCQITSRLAWTLPSTHLANRGEAGIVCVKTLSCKFGPLSGLIIEVKRILASRDWKRASLKLRFRGLGWFIKETLFWKSKEATTLWFVITVIKMGRL